MFNYSSHGICHHRYHQTNYNDCTTVLPVAAEIEIAKQLTLVRHTQQTHNLSQCCLVLQQLKLQSRILIGRELQEGE